MSGSDSRSVHVGGDDRDVEVLARAEDEPHLAAAVLGPERDPDLVLLAALVSTAFVSRWMSETYGADDSLGVHMAMIAILAAPITFGSVIHLYPDVFINLLVLIPALIWAMYLLYSGLPIALGISPERGMLMASSLVGWLLVGFVSLLGITVALWAHGLGPSIGA
jgi:hypothetical protein